MIIISWNIGISLLLEEANTMTSIVGYHENILSLKGLIVEEDGEYVSKVFYQAHIISIAYNQWLCVHINIRKQAFLINCTYHGKKTYTYTSLKHLFVIAVAPVGVLHGW